MFRRPGLRSQRATTRLALIPASSARPLELEPRGDGLTGLALAELDTVGTAGRD